MLINTRLTSQTSDKLQNTNRWPIGQLWGTSNNISLQSTSVSLFKLWLRQHKIEYHFDISVYVAPNNFGLFRINNRIKYQGIGLRIRSGCRDWQTISTKNRTNIFEKCFFYSPTYTRYRALRLKHFYDSMDTRFVILC